MARMWDAGDPEPATWDVFVPALTPSSDHWFKSDEDQTRITLIVSIGGESGTQVLAISHISVAALGVWASPGAVTSSDTATVRPHESIRRPTFRDTQTTSRAADFRNGGTHMTGVSYPRWVAPVGTLAVAIMTVLWAGSAAVASFPGENGLFLTMGQGMVRTVDATTGTSADVFPAIDAAWSPDGAFVAVSVMDGLGLDVVIVGVDGSDPVNLTAVEDGLALEPSWSADGQRLVYASHTEPGVLTTMARDGTDKQRIVLSGSFEVAVSPRWSPDGERILFWGVTAETEDRGLFTVDVDSGGVTPVAVESQHPDLGQIDPGDWSPDGSTVVFSARIEGDRGRAIMVVPASGGIGQPIVADGLQNDEPFWSPDGTLIAYQVDGESPVIRTVLPDGSGMADVAILQPGEGLKGWQPIPGP